MRYMNCGFVAAWLVLVACSEPGGEYGADTGQLHGEPTDSGGALEGGDTRELVRLGVHPKAKENCWGAVGPSPGEGRSWAARVLELEDTVELKTIWFESPYFEPYSQKGNSYVYEPWRGFNLAIWAQPVGSPLASPRYLLVPVPPSEEQIQADRTISVDIGDDGLVAEAGEALVIAVQFDSETEFNEDGTWAARANGVGVCLNEPRGYFSTPNAVPFEWRPINADPYVTIDAYVIP